MTRQLEKLQSTVVQQREAIARLKVDSESLDKLKVPNPSTAATDSWLMATGSLRTPGATTSRQLSRTNSTAAS